jgi:ribosomal subunit interface protein
VGSTVQLSVNGKQIDIGDALRSHIETELSIEVGKYFENPNGADVTVSKEGNDFRCDISVHVGKGIIVQGHAVAGDARASFDVASEHVGKRLRRYKRRLRDHHKRRNTKADWAVAQQYVLAAEPEPEPHGDVDEPEKPVVIAEMETVIEEMTVGEAVMRMDLANLPALMFRNSAHGGLNLVYYREDGNIGWVDPKSA